MASEDKNDQVENTSPSQASKTMSNAIDIPGLEDQDKIKEEQAATEGIKSENTVEGESSDSPGTKSNKMKLQSLDELEGEPQRNEASNVVSKMSSSKGRSHFAAIAKPKTGQGGCFGPQSAEDRRADSE